VLCGKRSACRGRSGPKSNAGRNSSGFCSARRRLRLVFGAHVRVGFVIAAITLEGSRAWRVFMLLRTRFPSISPLHQIGHEHLVCRRPRSRWEQLYRWRRQRVNIFTRSSVRERHSGSNVPPVGLTMGNGTVEPRVLAPFHGTTVELPRGSARPKGPLVCYYVIAGSSRLLCFQNVLAASLDSRSRTQAVCLD
jgi:hypothetical protein